jgi:pimeloyl-ACP methyl ester carboxylesterase
LPFDALAVTPMTIEVSANRITWRWQDNAIELGVTRAGKGQSLLMLPALSSISTRGEMRPLQQQFPDYATVAVDWPGFGDTPRPAVAWHPDAYRAFLAELLAVERPFATVAAGHAAGYCLEAAALRPHSAGRLCLLAPTWRGPLPTVFGKRHKAFGRIARAGDLPVFGAALYRLNVNPFMVRKMALGHVYRDPGALPESLLAEKLAVTNAKGARHASIRFVTGELDPMTSREEFLATAQRVTDPILLIFGAETPRKSKAEMEALAALPNVRTALLSAGKLGIHEECAAEAAVPLRAFLRPA